MARFRPTLVTGALVATAAILLAGCAPANPTTDPEASVAAAANIDDCDAAESTIDAVFLDVATDAMDVAVANLKEKYPELTINTQPRPSSNYDDLTKQVVADIAVGKRPDITMSGLGQVRFWVDTYQAQPIDPAVLSDTYQSQFLGAGTVDGEVYLAPAQISAPVLLVNETLLDDAGVTGDIETFDDLVAAAEKVSATTGNPSVSIPTDGLGEWFSQAFIQGAGGTFIAEDGSAAFDNEEGVEALSIWSRLAEKDLELGVGSQDAMAQFQGGNLGFLVWTTSAIRTVETGVAGKFDWMPVDLPSVNGEGGPLPAGGNGWIVLSEDPCDAAFSTALVSELLSTDAVLKASGSWASYIPVDSAAATQLLDSPEASPQSTYAWSYDKPFTPWGGFDGEITVQVNDLLRTMAQKLATGADAEPTISETVASINALTGK